MRHKINKPMTGIYEITLRAPGGREKTELVWLTSEYVYQDFMRRAAKNGLEVIIGERLCA